MSAALVDRLTLTPARVGGDGRRARRDRRPARPGRRDHLQLAAAERAGDRPGAVPIGVVDVIYESRPSIHRRRRRAGLKSGNAVILKGGVEAFAATRRSPACEGVAGAAAAAAAVQLIPTTDRAAVAALLRQRELVDDVIVPRGGPSLIEAITTRSAIPVIQHYAGIYVYVDDRADLAMAEAIAVNAQVQRPGVYNDGTLLVHRDVAGASQVAAPLRAAGVELRGYAHPRRARRNERQRDWRTEYVST
ncbi:MAG: hypothetical protein U0802_24740 [Candidatus Binatia bacterium]